MGFGICALLVIVSLALLGFLGHMAADRGADRIFFSALHALMSGFLIFALIIGNYVLAKTGIERIFGNESYKVDGNVKNAAKDAVGSLVFGEGKTSLAPLLALVLVLGSIAAAGLVHRKLRSSIGAVRDGSGGLNIFLPLLWVPMGLAVLALDTYILVLRLATMLYPQQLAKGFANAPSLFNFGQERTAAREVLLVFIVGYPCLVMLVESHFASAWATFMEAVRGFPLRETQNRVARQNLPATPTIAPRELLDGYFGELEEDDFIAGVPRA